MNQKLELKKKMKRLLLINLFIIVFSLLSYSCLFSQYDRLKKQAEELEKKDKYIQAAEIFEEIVNLEISNKLKLSNKQRYQLNSKISELYSKGGFNYIDKAIEFRKNALKINDTYEDRFLLGKLYYQNEQYNSAEEELLKAIKLNERHSPSHFYLGCSYFIQQRYTKSIDQFNKYVSLEPDSAKGFYFLGAAHKQQNDTSNAIHFLSIAIDKNPKYIKALLLWADILYEKDELKKAEEKYKNVLRIDKYNKYAKEGLDNIKKKRVKLEEIKNRWSDWLDKFNDAEIMSANKDVAFDSLQKTSEFNKTLKIEFEKIKNKYLKSLVNYAKQLKSKGKLKSAINVLEKAKGYTIDKEKINIDKTLFDLKEELRDKDFIRGLLRNGEKPIKKSEIEKEEIKKAIDYLKASEVVAKRKGYRSPIGLKNTQLEAMYKAGEKSYKDGELSWADVYFQSVYDQNPTFRNVDSLLREVHLSMKLDSYRGLINSIKDDQLSIKILEIILGLKSNINDQIKLIETQKRYFKDQIEEKLLKEDWICAEEYCNKLLGFDEERKYARDKLGQINKKKRQDKLIFVVSFIFYTLILIFIRNIIKKLIKLSNRIKLKKFVIWFGISLSVSIFITSLILAFIQHETEVDFDINTHITKFKTISENNQKFITLFDSSICASSITFDNIRCAIFNPKDFYNINNSNDYFKGNISMYPLAEGATFNIQIIPDDNNKLYLKKIEVSPSVELTLKKLDLNKQFTIDFIDLHKSRSSYDYQSSLYLNTNKFKIILSSCRINCNGIDRKVIQENEFQTYAIQFDRTPNPLSISLLRDKKSYLNMKLSKPITHFSLNRLRGKTVKDINFCKLIDNKQDSISTIQSGTIRFSIHGIKTIPPSSNSLEHFITNQRFFTINSIKITADDVNLKYRANVKSLKWSYDMNIKNKNEEIPSELEWIWYDKKWAAIIAIFFFIITPFLALLELIVKLKNLMYNNKATK